jgi:hypothetical protein
VKRLLGRLVTCQAKPGPCTGGYAHWQCQKRRWHGKRLPWQSKHLARPGVVHRYNNYVWADLTDPVHYIPVPIDMRVSYARD